MFEKEGTEASPPDEEQPKLKKRKHETEETSTPNKKSSFNTENAQKKGWGRSEEIKANAAASETRRQRRIQERTADTICFACRERGHAARDCHSNKNQSKAPIGICYRCGSSKHILSRCRKPVNNANPLPFASCFVCKGKGHLASTCSQNEKGVYPNGGSCKLCSKTDHLARDCPLRSKNAQPAEGILFNAIGAEGLGADEDDFMAFKRKSNQLAMEESTLQKTKSTSNKPVGATPKKKVVVF